MSGMPPTKRSLFQTPQRPSKRARTSKNSRTMRIPRSLLPEVKQDIVSALTTNSTNYAYSQISAAIGQGDASGERIGNKIRILRMRFNYDFSQLSLTGGVRILVTIPKDPSIPFVGIGVIGQTYSATTTVLHDLLLPDDPSVLAGTFDVVGPINVEYNGSTVFRNNVNITVESPGNGANLKNAISYTTWYTDG